ncbi:Deoxyhypusine synthase (DHS) [Durusdinium trenchii]|uniref:Deoxyhypusine synthase (DHS) n=1 Tax=Durusdinium trenchii TaxID=1381693 RepID=A0ABP0I8G3_9DINO
MAGYGEQDAEPREDAERLKTLQEWVLASSEELSSPHVVGYDFNQGVDYEALLQSYMTTGFQATNLGKAIQEIEQMLDWSLADEPVPEDEVDEFKDIEARRRVRTKIWLSYTSNLISSGLRETLRFLVQHRMVQVMITTAGGIEEDIIKCLAPTHLGDFALPGLDLRRKGINRIGNLLAPNENYCKFEDWITPILNAMHDEQEKDGVVWTPSKMIHRFGKEIDNPESVCYWAYRNNVPIFSPAITDGSIGDMLYFHSYKRSGFVLDLVQDIRAVNDQAMKARKTGVLVLGGGLVKHHCMNANLMRNGADFVVYVSTAQEFDGSDSGARPDEAVSWGKIRVDAQPVKVHAEATLVLPLMVAKTFARRLQKGEWNADGRDTPQCPRPLRQGLYSL